MKTKKDDLERILNNRVANSIHGWNFVLKEKGLKILIYAFKNGRYKSTDAIIENDSVKMLKHFPELENEINAYLNSIK